ncbi:MAG: DoxX family protein [Sphingobacteriales bacterium]|nr:DoxX family protein [Sphingobacteriales bacterium]
MNIKKIIPLVLRIAAALILLQILYFKFTAHPESVALFTKLGVEPWGRIGTGVFELIAGILLLLPPTVFAGALTGIGLMSGAIFSHLTIIGVDSAGDGGQLFILAIIVWICCAVLLWIYRAQGQKMYQSIAANK